MSIKFLWTDTETTGLNPEVNEIIQLAGIIESPGEYAAEFSYDIKPTNFDAISEDAFSAHKITVKEMRTFRDPAEVHAKFKKLLFKYVNPFNKDDKLILAGQNVTFDANFIDSFCKRNNDKYFRACVTSGTFDLRTMSVALEIFRNVKLFQSYTLTAICDVLNVRLDNAHNALADIKATRECCIKIYNEIVKGD